MARYRLVTDVRLTALPHVLLMGVLNVVPLTIAIRVRPIVRLGLPLSNQLCRKCFWLSPLDYSILFSRIITSNIHLNIFCKKTITFLNFNKL